MARSAADSAATWAISSFPSTSRACFCRCSTTALTAFSIPRLSAMGFAPAATLRMPRCTIARASTVAVVVPSPATSLVLVATSLASWAPMFSHGSSSSISLAMVTPSLVMVGAPHFLSRTTLRPFGPSVIETASASLSTPASKARRASSSYFSTFAGMKGSSWLAADGEDVAGGEDQVLHAVDLDLGAPVLRVDDLVAGLHVHGHPLAPGLVKPPRADRDDLALLGTLLGRVGDDQTGGGHLLLLAGLDHDPVLQRLQAELLLLGHSFLLDWLRPA